MKAVGRLQIGACATAFISAAFLVCAAAGGCLAQTSTLEPAEAEAQAIKMTMTCAELISLMKAKDLQTVGFAIQWLDGIYSGRSGRTEVPAGWGRTLAQGVGGTCAIRPNAERTVLDVVGEMHEKYGGPAPGPSPR